MLITNEVLIYLIRKYFPCKESEKIITTCSNALTIPQPKPDELKVHTFTPYLFKIPPTTVTQHIQSIHIY